MSEKRSIGEGKSKDAEKIIEDVKKNSSGNIDEIPKVHASEVQELSELQKEAAELSKNVAITIDESQKQNVAEDSSAPISEHALGQTTSRSDEISDSFVNFTRLYSKLAMGAVETMQENGRLYRRTMDALTDYNVNLMNTWFSFWAPTQQQRLSEA